MTQGMVTLAAAELVQIEVPEAARMRDLGARLAALLVPGDLVVLAGPLGAGKTTLVQGIGAGLGVRGPITSPTFVIARVHPSLRGGPDLVHADAYRLGSQLEVDDLDLDADFERCVTVVEWGEGLVEGLSAGHLLITISWTAAGAGQPPAGAISPGVADQSNSGQGDASSSGDAPGQGSGDAPGQDDGDEPRRVTLAGSGDRWLTAAGQLRTLSRYQ